MFVALNQFWPKSFQERPNKFDLVCHGLMATMVVTRFTTYGDFNFEPIGAAWIALAIAGYMLFNISIKLGRGHRATNLVMNVIGGLVLWGWGTAQGETTLIANMPVIGSAILGGIAIFGIVRGLGQSYAHFGAKNKASLVAPLVYDGILVASPAIMAVTGEAPSNWTFGVAAGMLAITIARYRHHTK